MTFCYGKAKAHFICRVGIDLAGKPASVGLHILAITWSAKMARGAKDGRGANGGVRKKPRANFMGLQWWRKLLLPKRGKKESLLAPAPLSKSQETCVEKRRSMLYESIITPRVTRMKHLARASWDDQAGLATVETNRGNSIQTMGIFEEGRQKLFPEDALFLVDKGSLELSLNNLPMSVQRTWSYCMHTATSLTLQQYLTYAFLRRAGYVVRRYEKEAKQEGTALTPSLSAWRVGSFKRRQNESRPAAFHIVVFSFEDGLPSIEDIAALTHATSDRTRVRFAIVDRGIVVLNDAATNATPLSDRFIGRLDTAEAQSAIALRNGDASGCVDEDVLAAWDEPCADGDGEGH